MMHDMKANNVELQALFDKIKKMETITMKESLKGIEPIDLSSNVLEGREKISFSVRKEEDLCVREVT